MPSFRDRLKDKPETNWNLVAFVLQIAEIRREGAIPDSGVLEDGFLKTLPGVKVGPAAPATSSYRPRTAGTTELAVR
jgi:hypothetical protein